MFASATATRISHSSSERSEGSGGGSDLARLDSSSPPPVPAGQAGLAANLNKLVELFDKSAAHFSFSSPLHELFRGREE